MPFEIPDEDLLQDDKMRGASYAYISLVVGTILILLSILATLIRDRQHLLQRPCSRFACSLLVAHIINNTFLLALKSLYVRSNWIPERVTETPPEVIKDARLIIFIHDVTVSLKILVSTSVILLTTDRFLSLHLHLSYSAWLTKSKQCIFLAIAWLIPLVQLIVCNLYTVHIAQGYVLLGTISLSLLILSVLNRYIYVQVKLHLKAMRRDTLASDTNGALVLDSKEKKSLAITILIVASYCIAYLPEVASQLLEIFAGETEDELVLTSAYLNIINSLIDAVVYLFLNEDVRRNYFSFRMFKNKCKSVIGTHTPAHFEVKPNEKDSENTKTPTTSH